MPLAKGKNSDTIVFVELLMKTFGVPVEGTIVNYESIETCINEKRHSNRWISICGRWKAKLFEDHNVLMRPQINRGYEACVPTARVDVAGRTFNCGIKRIRRAAIISTRTARMDLNPEQIKTLTHIEMNNAKIMMAEAKSARTIKLEVSLSKQTRNTTVKSREKAHGALKKTLQ